MKQLLLSIVMFFTITMQGHDLSDKLRGAWSSAQTSYYVVILHDNEKGYEIINFSFEQNKTLKETVIEEGADYIKTKLFNPENNYKVEVKYTFVDNELHCTFTGDSNHVTIYKRYWLITN